MRNATGPIWMGGYVWAWKDWKISFEVTNNKSVPEDHEPRYGALGHWRRQQAERWISDVLKNQTLQANQCVTFQIGGDVRGF
jgi:hypothetical protein